MIRTLAAAAVALSFAAAPAVAHETQPQMTFKAGDGAARGHGHYWEGKTGVLFEVELEGLTPGWHAVHLHAKGDCSNADLTSAGAHINHPAGHGAPAEHGLLNPKGPDFGDLPNVWAGADGKAHAQVFSALVSMKGEGGRPALLDADGSSFVVHASPDDHKTQPIGGAGARVACAVIK